MASGNTGSFDLLSGRSEFGFIDRSGKIGISATFDGASSLGFANGPALVRSNGKWGFIDKAGKWVVEPQFDNGRDFTGGVAPVSVSGKWGYIDSGGKFVINPQFEGAFDFDDNDHAPVRDGGKWTLIDKKGIAVGDQGFLEISTVWADGLRAARTTEGWGYVQGAKFVIRPLFDSADPFLGGLARVTLGGEEVYVDKMGGYAGDPFKGRAIRPTHVVQEIWEGDVIAPAWKAHEKFLLLREGDKIKGFYTSPSTDPSALGNLADVGADINQDKSFRLVSENGLVWKGRFLAPVVIAGTRPNGEEGKAPEFPFRLHFVRDATADDLPMPLQPTSQDWDAFLGKF